MIKTTTCFCKIKANSRAGLCWQCPLLADTQAPSPAWLTAHPDKDTRLFIIMMSRWTSSWNIYQLPVIPGENLLNQYTNLLYAITKVCMHRISWLHYLRMQHNWDWLDDWRKYITTRFCFTEKQLTEPRPQFALSWRADARFCPSHLPGTWQSWGQWEVPRALDLSLPLPLLPSASEQPAPLPFASLPSLAELWIFCRHRLCPPLFIVFNDPMGCAGTCYVLAEHKTIGETVK